MIWSLLWILRAFFKYGSYFFFRKASTVSPENGNSFYVAINDFQTNISTSSSRKIVSRVTKGMTSIRAFCLKKQSVDEF